MSAPIVAFANLKGGVGKTALTLHVADALHRAGNRVLVVDLDPQATAQEWAATGAAAGVDGPPVIGMKSQNLHRDLPRQAEGADIVLIDCPPRLGRETRAAVIASDLVVSPLNPGAESLWAFLGDTLELLNEARELRPEIRTAAIINRAAKGEVATRQTQATLENASVPLWSEALGHRAVFVRSVAEGRGASTYAPRSAAAVEVERLTRRMLAELEVSA